MRVLIFTQQFGKLWSGVGTYATNLVSGLEKRGVDVTVVCPSGMHSESGDFDIREVAIKGWEHKVNYWLPLAWRYAMVLRSVPASERFDLAHFTDAREALFASRGAMPMVGTVNDYYPAACPLNPLALKPHYAEWPARWAYWRGVRLLEPFAYRKLDAAIANSDFVARILEKSYRIDRKSIEVINYGIDDSGVENTAELEGKPSVLFVGTNFQRKGLPDLIEAVSKARESSPEIMLHVVGDDPRRAVIEATASKLGVGGNIKFHGGLPNDEVRRMKPDVFAMPSLIEGFGIVFLEFMLAGVPVVGGRTGGTVELIEDGRNGFTIAPGDTGGLARKILKASETGRPREKIIREGLKTASKYTTDRMVDRTILLYEKTVGGK